MTTLERFEAKIEINSAGCWEWTGYRNEPWGYGYFRVDGKPTRVHRWAYEHFIGPIPNGMVLDHLCRVRHCANPAHLQPVTPRENQLRGDSPTGRNARKTHCPQGHEYAVHGRRTKAGRVCAICARAKQRRYVERRQSLVSSQRAA